MIPMFSPPDLQQLKDKGISEAEARRQLALFFTPPAPARLERPCTAGAGVSRLSVAEESKYEALGAAALKTGRVSKFTPASGAATRMFQALQAEPQGKEAEVFRSGLKKFALAPSLGQGDPVERALELYAHALKALIPFHKYANLTRTPYQEHLREAEALGIKKLHFTVSAEHRQGFAAHPEVSFSEQKPFTDTLAGQPDGTPFRDVSGRLLFRPGGHGALMANLNDLQADLVLIKNIDNISHSDHWQNQLRWKKIILGLLLAQGPCQGRPRRVCGVVTNTGEPGGGPFWVKRVGKSDAQIVEAAQIDMNDSGQKAVFQASTHFNPVDLACAVRDETGLPFDLKKYCDDSAVFISKKFKDGKPLLALELPGLWNGAMAQWDTLFVEVPLETFNPVKTVNDLLKAAHQPL